jgi:hypothetical protein
VTVPSLLKRWKRLDTGLELSAEAFLNLSKRFKKNTKEWAQADKDTQRSRNRKPESMDIYDTVKGQGLRNILLNVIITYAIIQLHLVQTFRRDYVRRRPQVYQLRVKPPGSHVALRFRKCSKHTCSANITMLIGI